MAEHMAELNKGISIKIGASENISYTGTPSSSSTASSTIRFVAPYSGFYVVKSIAASPNGWINGPDSSMQAQADYYVYVCGMANKGETISINTYNLKVATQFQVKMRKVYAD